jgi:phosphoribosylformimino-5-aminoimidazole carboxamide ribotide isomerase
LDEIGSAHARLALPAAHVVIGTERQRSGALLEALYQHPRAILSLDYVAGNYAGPAEVLSNVEIWPQTVIVMTLDRVGSTHGPDFARLSEVIERAEDRSIIAAGGVRGPHDLEKLAQLGAEGALVASAIHAGRLATADIERFENSKGPSGPFVRSP